MSKTQQEITQTSMWSPLGYPAFRAIWIAVTISNTGTWMHDMGVGWLMATMTDSSFMVALVQTATTLPFFLLALPAGTLADIVAVATVATTIAINGDPLKAKLSRLVRNCRYENPW